MDYLFLIIVVYMYSTAKNWSTSKYVYIEYNTT